MRQALEKRPRPGPLLQLPFQKDSEVFASFSRTLQIPRSCIVQGNRVGYFFRFHQSTYFLRFFSSPEMLSENSESNQPRFDSPLKEVRWGIKQGSFYRSPPRAELLSKKPAIHVRDLDRNFLTFSRRHTGESRYPENVACGWIPAKSMPE